MRISRASMSAAWRVLLETCDPGADAVFAPVSNPELDPLVYPSVRSDIFRTVLLETGDAQRGAPPRYSWTPTEGPIGLGNSRLEGVTPGVQVLGGRGDLLLDAEEHAAVVFAPAERRALADDPAGWEG